MQPFVQLNNKITFLFFLDVSRTFSLLQGFRFKPASGPVWKTGFEGQIAEQAIFDQSAAMIVNAVRGVVGWLVVEFVAYRGQNFFEKPKNPKIQNSKKHDLAVEHP